VTESDGAKKGNAVAVDVKKTTTTEASELGSVDTTSKYHQSNALVLTGWILGASRPVAEEVNRAVLVLLLTAAGIS
jgi:hypothetical protein